MEETSIAYHDQTRILMKEQYAIRMLGEATTKVISKYEQLQMNKNYSIDQLHFKFNEEYRQELSEHFSTFFSQQESCQGMNLIRIFDSLISSIAKSNEFVQKQIARKDTINLNKKAPKLSQKIKGSVCEKCEGIITGRKIQLQKIRLLHCQFQDPYNVFTAGKMDFMREFEPEPPAEQIDTIVNQRIVQKHINNLKERINHRANEIVALLTEFRKFGTASESNRRPSGPEIAAFKNYGSCLQQVIALLHKKFLHLFIKIKKEREQQEKNDIGIQTSNYQNIFLQSNAEKELLQRQLDLKTRQNDDLRETIDHLQKQILLQKQEKQNFKLMNCQLKKANEKMLEGYEKEKEYHQSTLQILTQKQQELQSVRNQSKQKDWQVEKLQQQLKQLKTKNAKLLKNRRSRKSSTAAQGRFIENQVRQSDSFTQEEEYIYKTATRIKNKFKANRKPTFQSHLTIQGNQTSKNILSEEEEQDKISCEYIGEEGQPLEDLEKIKEIRHMESIADRIRESGNYDAESPTLQKNEKKTDRKQQKIKSNILKEEKRAKFPAIKEHSQSDLFQNTQLSTAFSQHQKIGLNLIKQRDSAPIHHQQQTLKSQTNKNMSKTQAIKKSSSQPQSSRGDSLAVKNHRNEIELLKINQGNKNKNFGEKRLSKKNKINQTVDHGFNQHLEKGEFVDSYPSTFANSFSNINLRTIESTNKENTQIFNLADLENLYFGVQGALEHEKACKKHSREAAPIMISSVTYLNKILALIAFINSRSRILYECVKGLLICPYQSVVSQQNYLYISKSVPTSQKIKSSLSKILQLHRACRNDKKICEHLNIFFVRLSELLDKIS